MFGEVNGDRGWACGNCPSSAGRLFSNTTSLDAHRHIGAICKVYLVDTTEVPDFNQQYELYDPCTLMFFFRGRHVQLELGVGDRYKIAWPLGGEKELVDIVEAVHRGAQQGRDLIVALRDYSLAYRY